MVRMPYRTGGISCHGLADAVPGETGVLLRWLAACRPARPRRRAGLLRLGEDILRSSPALVAERHRLSKSFQNASSLPSMNAYLFDGFR